MIKLYDTVLFQSVRFSVCDLVVLIQKDNFTDRFLDELLFGSIGFATRICTKTG